MEVIWFLEPNNACCTLHGVHSSLYLYDCCKQYIYLYIYLHSLQHSHYCYSNLYYLTQHSMLTYVILLPKTLLVWMLAQHSFYCCCNLYFWLKLLLLPQLSLLIHNLYIKVKQNLSYFTLVTILSVGHFFAWKHQERPSAVSFTDNILALKLLSKNTNVGLFKLQYLSYF